MLTGIINKPLLLHLVGCLYYLYQLCTVKQISDNEIYLLIKYVKSILWRVGKRLSYIEEARCLKVNMLPLLVLEEGSEVVKIFSNKSDTLESIAYLVSMQSGAELLDTRTKMSSERCYQNI